MARTVIVGSRGQDGRILWDQLDKRGDSIVGIHRSGIDTIRTDWNERVDIACPQSVLQFLTDFSPDHIYYLAAHHHSSQGVLKSEMESCTQSWKVNVEYFSNFLEGARRCNRQPHIFYASSSRIFGATSTSMQSETTVHQPACLYGVTKSTSMMLADYHRRCHGARVSCGVLYNHESPLRAPEFLSQRVVEGLARIKLGKAQQLEIGSLDARVDWGYAPDYTRAMQSIVESDCSEDFVIATGKTHSVREMIALAADYIGVDWRNVVVENANVLTRPSQSLCGDSSRICRATGWRPSVGFNELIKIMALSALDRAKKQDAEDNETGLTAASGDLAVTRF